MSFSMQREASGSLKCFCYFAFQWSLHMHRFAYGTWKTNWRIRWRAPESRNHPWESYLKHWVNKKRTSIKFKTFWRASSRSERSLSFSLEWRNRFQLARFQKTTPFIPTSLIGKANVFFTVCFFFSIMEWNNCIDNKSALCLFTSQVNCKRMQFKTTTSSKDFSKTFREMCHMCIVYFCVSYVHI